MKSPLFTEQQWCSLSLVSGLTTKHILTVGNHYPELFESLFVLPLKELKRLGFSEKQYDQLHNPDPIQMSRIENWLKESPLNQIVTISDARYPTLLTQITVPPLILFTKGDASLLSSQQLAFVGTRRPTHHATRCTTQLVGDAVKRGFVITSGLAVGIDGTAHRSTLNHHGKTIAVLGSGLGSVYPKRHSELANRIVENGGCLVSEFMPFSPALKHHFPQRNRIISGLSVGVVITEAAIKSGSLITARYALEQDREVFAIPGQINNPNSKGCHWLIKQGATLTESIDDILEQLNFDLTFAKSVEKKNEIKKIEENQLSTDKLLYSIEYEVTSLDVIVERTSLSVTELLPQLLEYELNGKIASVPGGYIKVEG